MAKSRAKSAVCGQTRNQIATNLRFVPDLSCVALLQQDVDWACFRKTGKGEMIPLGTACKDDMIIKIDSWPHLEWEDCASSYHTNPNFKQEWVSAMAVYKGQILRSFQPAKVTSASSMGLMVMRDFLVCDAQEYLDHFGWSHESVEGLTVIDGVLNQEGNCVPGILMKDPDRPFRTLRVFAQASNGMDTHMLMPESHHREAQGSEAYEQLRQQVLRSRHAGLRTGAQSWERTAIPPRSKQRCKPERPRPRKFHLYEINNMLI